MIADILTIGGMIAIAAAAWIAHPSAGLAIVGVEMFVCGLYLAGKVAK